MSRRHVRASANDVVVKNGFLTGTNCNTVYMGETGIANVVNEGNHLDTTSYAILTNSNNATAAYDIKNVTVRHNRFTNVRSDAIEFNHPSSSASQAVGFLVDGNYIECPDRVGGGPSSGFGIGVAGAVGGQIVNNHIVFARNQGIHIEDNCSDWVVEGNIIDAVDGTLARLSVSLNVGISIADTDRVRVADNLVRGTRGAGIETLYAGASSILNDVAITDNTVTTCAKGMTIGGAAGGARFVVTGNIVSSNTGDGASIGGDFNELLLDNNLIINNGGWALAVKVSMVVNCASTTRTSSTATRPAT